MLSIDKSTVFTFHGNHIKFFSFFADKFTESDIIGNAILMFTSGSGTVTSTLTFCFYELALNKHIQNKLREEIKKAITKYSGQFNYDFLMNLSYAKKVLDGRYKSS